MMATTKTLILLCLVHLILLTTCAYGLEKSFPEIRKMMPAFAIKTDSKKKEEVYSNTSLHGKHYILDSWSTGCGACVASFPKTDSIQSRYGDSLKITLFGLEEKNRNIRQVYEEYRKKDNLKLTTEFDSVNFNRFVPFSVPHIICVDGQGVVKAIRKYPVIGEAIPEFSLKIDEHNSISSAQLKGKPYILDFWNIGCFACIESFPKMHDIQQKYQDDLNVILVGLEDKHRDIRKVYETYRKRFSLNLTTSFDSSAYKRFVPFAAPHLIWVDGTGMVKAITTAVDVSNSNIENFIAGIPFKFEDRSFTKNTADAEFFDKNKPLLINGNGGNDNDYLFRSLITLFDPKHSKATVPDVVPYVDNTTARYQVIGASLEAMYTLAFHGTVLLNSNSREIYRSPDISVEAMENTEKRFKQRQKFNYSIELPKSVATKEKIMKLMQHDLSTFFGFSAALIQKEKVCFSLIVTDPNKFEKLKAAPGKTTGSWLPENKVNFLNNVPIDGLLETMRYSILKPELAVAYNDTGYNGSLSLSIRANVHDYEGIRKELRKVGLDLVQKAVLLWVVDITEEH